ncbi:MAG: hypothetical protein LH603_01805 [Pseudonocardia sp.]|nr:hypothetical protein [Pseudonocardia sp.]
MRKPDEMANHHAVGLAEDTRASLHLLVAQSPRGTDRSTVDAVEGASEERVDQHAAGRVGRQDADQVIHNVSDRFVHEEQGFERRLIAIRARTATPEVRFASAGGDSPATMERPDGQQTITDAEDTYHLIWDPAGTGIVDFVAAVAYLAVRVDTAPRTETGRGSTDRGGARDRHGGGGGKAAAGRGRAVPPAPPRPPALAADLLGWVGSVSPSAFDVPLVPEAQTAGATDVVRGPVPAGAGPNPDDWGGRELLDWGAGWADTMTDDLVDSIDRLLDGLESQLFGPLDEAHGATAADLSLVPTPIRHAGHPS